MPLYKPKKQELAEENKRLKSALASLQSGGRPRIYLSNAERQRAYRERKRQEAVAQCS